MKHTINIVVFLLGICALVVAAETGAQGVPLPERDVRLSWEKPTDQEDGTPIAAADLSVTVYRQDGSEVCTEASATNCGSTLAWDTCETYYATATQLSTGLTSAASIAVEACAGAEPDWDVAPRPPTLEVSLM